MKSFILRIQLFLLNIKHHIKLFVDSKYKERQKLLEELAKENQEMELYND